ncbi:hypothetical protein [Vibrio gazogenes]|uniref:Uncharacterized protein n=1 Tax=Vibrio gazogenes DSM 21264 = NBRC 103151 TaxID=1123492 RepID=A0A1M4SJZ2_VIBGA|nr:hypothetical protein [Vibrio gazogenes]USP15889.1 hypothetical protein MKS89_15950 [Vibrio gazogenes]SHE32505.1 hypothetical protein SAMN02745781_00088 [Vibrio gazogenes DSM 21264] [Vibrio gazogenes DSM 21264 = NBRC 103151]SJN57576.1 hypothetical protein BQ6471_02604 [Vibrio gazogenes]
MKAEKRKVTQKMIYRSVASSTAIETGDSIKTIEQKLKSNKKKHAHLTLAG